MPWCGQTWEEGLFCLKEGVEAGGFPGEPGVNRVWVGEELAEGRGSAGRGLMAFFFFYVTVNVTIT